MLVEGIVMNGRVVAAAPESWPEGSRVFVSLVEEPEDSGPPDEFGREELLASLRESISGVKAGRGRSIEAVMADITAEFGLPE